VQPSCCACVIAKCGPAKLIPLVWAATWTCQTNRYIQYK
jgi:hypothetical protein